MKEDLLKLSISELARLLEWAEVLFTEEKVSGKKKKEATKTIKAVNSALARFTEEWVFKFIQATAEEGQKRKEGHNAVSSFTILTARLSATVIKTRQVARLMDIIFDLFVRHYDTPELCYSIAQVPLGWLACNDELTKEVINICGDDNERRNKLLLILYHWYEAGLDIELVTENPEFWIDNGRRIYWRIIPEWEMPLGIMLNKAKQMVNQKRKALEDLAKTKVDWEMAEVLWKMIKDDARVTLHQDGDEVAVEVPELQVQRLNSFTLEPSTPFPSAQISLDGTLFGCTTHTECKLVDGRLTGIELDSEEYEWFLTMTILAAYWMIVTRPICDVQESESSGNGRAYQRRKARPHFQRLQPGHKAHDEAIANAVKHLGREPAPGYTFWTPQEDGVEMIKVTRRVMTIKPGDLAEFI